MLLLLIISRKWIKQRLLLLSAAVGSLPTSVPAVAAEITSEIAVEEVGQPEDQVITVTASRSGEAIEDLPVAVTVLEEAALQRQLQTSSDILRALDFTVPGTPLFEVCWSRLDFA